MKPIINYKGQIDARINYRRDNICKYCGGRFRLKATLYTHLTKKHKEGLDSKK